MLKGTAFGSLLCRGFITLFACYCLVCTCFAFVNVGLLLHTTEDLGMDSVVIGSVIGIVSIIGLCMRPVSAVVVDKLDRKWLIVLAFFFEAAATLGFAHATDYWMFYALQVVRGVAWALISCAGAVMLVGYVGRDNLGIALGVYALGMVVGSSVAASIVAPMGDAIGFTATFSVGSALAVVAGFLALTLPFKHRRSEFEAVKKKLLATRLRDLFSVECAPIMGLSFVFQICATALSATYLIAFGRVDLSIANVGIVATIYNVIMYATRPMYGWIMDRFGARWCIGPCLVGMIFANLAVFLSTDFTGLIVAAVIFGLCSGGYSVAPRTMAMRRLGEGREAVSSSTAGIGNDIGMFLGMTLVPAIATLFAGSYRNAYLVMAVVAAAGTLYALAYARFYLKKHPENEMGL